jgi:4-amino-4-deoxy-L-arabinose transferase-like glycosyltransferase
MLAKFLCPLELILLFVFSLLLFTWGISHQEITGFESRFYLFAQEMWEHGPTWFPTTYQEAYPDYPALATFLIYLTSYIMGGLNKLSAVLPSAIASALTLVVTYLIGAKENKKWGWVAVFFLLLTFTFTKTARLVALDMYPTLLTACCFYFVYTRDQDKQPVPWILLSLFLVLSFAFRGPIGLVIPAGVIASYYFLGKEYKILFLFLILAGSLLVISTSVLLVLAYYQGGSVFMHDVLRMEVLGRLHDSAPPFYFYLLNGISNYSLSFISAFLVIIGLLYLQYKKKNYSHPVLVMRLIGWIMIILIGMSLPADKKIRYILPVSPALALLAAYVFVEETKEKYFIYLRNFLNILLLLSPFILMSYFLIVEPLQLYHERARDFVEKVEKQRLLQRASLVFYKERADGLAIKYLINMPERILPIFIQSEDDLRKIKQPAFFIARETNFMQISEKNRQSFHVLIKEQLGHENMVVFTVD